MWTLCIVGEHELMTESNSNLMLNSLFFSKHISENLHFDPDVWETLLTLSTNEASPEVSREPQSLQNVWMYTQNIWIIFVLISSFEKETTTQQRKRGLGERDEILTVN